MPCKETWISVGEAELWQQQTDESAERQHQSR